MPRTCLACLSRRLGSMRLEGSSLGQRSYSAVPKPPRTNDSTSPKPPRSETRTRSSTRKHEGRSTKPPSFGLKPALKEETAPSTTNVLPPDNGGQGDQSAGSSRTTSEKTTGDRRRLNTSQSKKVLPKLRRPSSRYEDESTAGPSRIVPDKMDKQREPLYPPARSASPPAMDFSALPPHPSPRSRVGLCPQSSLISKLN
jgi:hypothetical protein